MIDEGWLFDVTCCGAIAAGVHVMTLADGRTIAQPAFPTWDEYDRASHRLVGDPGRIVPPISQPAFIELLRTGQLRERWEITCQVCGRRVVARWDKLEALAIASRGVGVSQLPLAGLERMLGDI